MKKIVITGVTKGLGLAMAKYFADQGHWIFGCGRSADQITKLHENFGSPHDFRQLDVSSDPVVKTWVHDLLDKYGPPDLLINNAALINQTTNLWEVTQDDFDRVIDVNIKGVANMLRHFIPAMLANGTKGHGVIVNLSSGWGRSTSPEVAPYCATKWAIEGLTLALAQELPQGMAAVPLNPGIIDTEMLRDCFGEGAGSYPNANQWVKRAGPFILDLGPKDNGASLTVPI
ncbi:MAG: SDR family oxidoreductase [Verrucomicrobiota bacterium]